MKKYHQFAFAALTALTIFAGAPARADNMASIGITPATGVVTLAPQWSIGAGLAGFHHMSQDLGLGGQANNFYSIINDEIPLGGNILAFNLYVAASGFATPHEDIGSKLTPYSYSALTSADPDVGYGSVNFYFIHHKSTGDYFSVLVPGSSVSSAVTDLKPMDGPGGPATLGTSGYFGLTFASSNLGYGLNQFYYLRTHAVTGDTIFGTLDPGLLNTSADQFSLGTDGHVALTFTGVDVGYGTDKMYYLRQDPITGYTILGMLNPDLAGVRHTADIANLGSVFTTLTFTASDLGFGVNKFYATGSINPTWQSVSFAAIADRAVIDGSFTVHPTASSGLPIDLTVVTGSATISSPVGGAFTITPTAGGLITLQATQVGATNPTTYEYNMLRQSFMVSGETAGQPDFNSDGKTDLIWNHPGTGEIGIELLDGLTPVSYTVRGFYPGWTVSAGDFNGDGKSDLIWSHPGTGEIGIELLDGLTPVSYTRRGFYPGWTASAGDFNGDGGSDLIWSHPGTGEIGIELLNGLTPVSYTRRGFYPGWTASAGDFNSDGGSDLIWNHPGTGEIGIELLNGLTPVSYTRRGFYPGWTVRAGDFNSDGGSDLIWNHPGTGEIGIELLNGLTPVSYTVRGFYSGWKISN